MPQITMPRLSDSMEEGTVVSWLKPDGSVVARGEEFVEIETDKAQMSYEADEAGVLRHLVAEGATLPVGAPIATIGDPADGEPSERGDGTEVPQASAQEHPPAAGRPPADASPAAGARDGGAVAASPVARRLARELGVDLASVRGSGPNGRVVKADVEQAAASTTAGGPAPEPRQPAVPAAPAGAPAARASDVKGTVTRTRLTRLQQTVARRMSESKATIPEFSVAVDVDMEEALALRATLAERDVRFTVNDLLIKAVAVALTRHPRVNGAYRDGEIETYARVNVGVAVASDDALVVPTVLDADTKPLTAIAADVRRLAGAVRDGSITPPELAGGTFTVSNLGMFGVDEFAGIVNPPQAAILCAGAMAPRAVPGADGACVVRRVMRLTLVSDHRILYGADAARFLAEVKALLETPAAALV